MSFNRRRLWQYPLFQIPLMLLLACLVTAALFWLLGLGRPPVAVAIAIDLSTSTYDTQFNAPGTVMYQEVQAVRSYLQENARQPRLANQNQIQIFGFGGLVRSLTNDEFKTDSQQLNAEFTQALQDPNLPQLVANNTTDISLAIQKTTEALSQVPNRCRELLLVTDGAAPVTREVVNEAVRQRVRINSVVVGAEESPELQNAALQTRGDYLTADVSNLEAFFTNQFVRFNSNLKWIILWLGGAWIALMWLLTLPLDRWIYQGLFKLPMNLAGQLSLGNAWFWSALTPIIVWQLFNLLDLPFFASC